MIQRSENYNAIDLTKFIMAIFVVAIHTNPLYKFDNDIITTLYECTVRCAVPFFFIASGFFVSLKMNKIDAKQDKILVIRKQLVRILKMYIVWSVIYLPLAIYGFAKNNCSLLDSILSYAKGFLLYGENFNSWMLWYLLSTIYALLFIEFLLRKNISLNTICIIGSLFLLIGLSIDYLVNMESNLPNALESTKTIIKNTIVNGRIFTGFFYIPVGMLLAQKSINLYLSTVFFVVGFAGNFLFEDIIGNLFLALCCTGLFSIISYIRLPNSPMFLYFRQSSTIIYLIHMYVMTLFDLTLYGYMRVGLKVFIVTTFISCLLSFIYITYTQLYKKFKTKKSTYIT